MNCQLCHTEKESKYVCTNCCGTLVEFYGSEYAIFDKEKERIFNEIKENEQQQLVNQQRLELRSQILIKSNLVKNAQQRIDAIKKKVQSHKKTLASQSDRLHQLRQSLDRRRNLNIVEDSSDLSTMPQLEQITTQRDKLLSQLQALINLNLLQKGSRQNLFTFFSFIVDDAQMFKTLSKHQYNAVVNQAAQVTKVLMNYLHLNTVAGELVQIATICPFELLCINGAPHICVTQMLLSKHPLILPLFKSSKLYDSHSLIGLCCFIYLLQWLLEVHQCPVDNAQSLFQSLISLLTSLNGQQILEYNPQSNLEFKEKLLTVMVQQFKLYKVTVTNDSLLICQRLLQSDYLRFKDMIADVQQDNSTSVNTADQLEDDEWDMIKAADIETAD